MSIITLMSFMNVSEHDLLIDDARNTLSRELPDFIFKMDAFQDDNTDRNYFRNLCSAILSLQCRLEAKDIYDFSITDYCGGHWFFGFHEAKIYRTDEYGNFNSSEGWDLESLMEL